MWEWEEKKPTDKPYNEEKHLHKDENAANIKALLTKKGVWEVSERVQWILKAISKRCGSGGQTQASKFVMVRE